MTEGHAIAGLLAPEVPSAECARLLAAVLPEKADTAISALRPYQDVTYNAALTRNFCMMPVGFLLYFGKATPHGVPDMTLGELCSRFLTTDGQPSSGDIRLLRRVGTGLGDYLSEFNQYNMRLRPSAPPPNQEASASACEEGPSHWWPDIEYANKSSFEAKGTHAQVTCLYRMLWMPMGVLHETIDYLLGTHAPAKWDMPEHLAPADYSNKRVLADVLGEYRDYHLHGPLPYLQDYFMDELVVPCAQVWRKLQATN